MSLASDFTYFMDDPVNGDQFTQKDARWVGGLSGSHLWREKVCGLRTENLVGFQTRSDHIDNGLSKTNRRVFVSQVRRDDIAETSGALYFQNTTHWTEWFRTVAGVRGDL